MLDEASTCIKWHMVDTMCRVMYRLKISWRCGEPFRSMVDISIL